MMRFLLLLLLLAGLAAAIPECALDSTSLCEACSTLNKTTCTAEEAQVALLQAQLDNATTANAILRKRANALKVESISQKNPETFFSVDIAIPLISESDYDGEGFTVTEAMAKDISGRCNSEEFQILWTERRVMSKEEYANSPYAGLENDPVERQNIIDNGLQTKKKRKRNEDRLASSHCFDNECVDWDSTYVQRDNEAVEPLVNDAEIQKLNGLDDSMVGMVKINVVVVGDAKLDSTSSLPKDRDGNSSAPALSTGRVAEATYSYPDEKQEVVCEDKLGCGESEYDAVEEGKIDKLRAEAGAGNTTTITTPAPTTTTPIVTTTSVSESGANFTRKDGISLEKRFTEDNRGGQVEYDLERVQRYGEFLQCVNEFLNDEELAGHLRVNRQRTRPKTDEEALCGFVGCSEEVEGYVPNEYRSNGTRVDTQNQCLYAGALREGNDACVLPGEEEFNAEEFERTILDVRGLVADSCTCGAVIEGTCAAKCESNTKTPPRCHSACRENEYCNPEYKCQACDGDTMCSDFLTVLSEWNSTYSVSSNTCGSASCICDADPAMVAFFNQDGRKLWRDTIIQYGKEMSLTQTNGCSFIATNDFPTVLSKLTVDSRRTCVGNFDAYMVDAEFFDETEGFSEERERLYYEKAYDPESFDGCPRHPLCHSLCTNPDEVCNPISRQCGPVSNLVSMPTIRPGISLCEKNYVVQGIYNNDTKTIDVLRASTPPLSVVQQTSPNYANVLTEYDNCDIGDNSTGMNGAEFNIRIPSLNGKFVRGAGTVVSLYVQSDASPSETTLLNVRFSERAESNSWYQCQTAITTPLSGSDNNAYFSIVPVSTTRETLITVDFADDIPYTINMFFDGCWSKEICNPKNEFQGSVKEVVKTQQFGEGEEGGSFIPDFQRLNLFQDFQDVKEGYLQNRAVLNALSDQPNDVVGWLSILGNSINAKVQTGESISTLDLSKITSILDGGNSNVEAFLRTGDCNFPPALFQSGESFSLAGDMRSRGLHMPIQEPSVVVLRAGFDDEAFTDPERLFSWSLDLVQGFHYIAKTALCPTGLAIPSGGATPTLDVTLTLATEINSITPVTSNLFRDGWCNTGLTLHTRGVEQVVRIPGHVTQISFEVVSATFAVPAPIVSYLWIGATYDATTTAGCVANFCDANGDSSIFESTLYEVTSIPSGANLLDLNGAVEGQDTLLHLDYGFNLANTFLSFDPHQFVIRIIATQCSTPSVPECPITP